MKYIDSCLMMTAMLLAAGCSHRHEPMMLSQMGGVQIQMQYADLDVDIDSAVVKITADDMNEPWVKTFSDVSSSLSLQGLTPGVGRTLSVTLWSEGLQTHYGETMMDLQAGEVLNLNLSLQSLVGHVRLQVPLGIQNTLKIDSGWLWYVDLNDSTVRDTLPLMGDSLVREFCFPLLTLSHDYHIELELLDVQGDLLFWGVDTLQLDTLGSVASIQLHGTKTELELMITIEETRRVSSSVLLPGAVKRAPQLLHEVFLTELMINARTNGNDYEWVEVYNASLDTLTLEGCYLARDRETTGSTTRTSLDGIHLPPGEFSVWGRDSVDFADAHYTGFTLTNSNQSLVLYCDNLLLDSIYYYAENDSLNPFPHGEGYSMQVSLSDYLQRNQGSRWCLGQDSIMHSLGLVIWGSPGEDAFCLD